MLKRYRVRRDGGTGRVAMPSARRTGPSYMRGGVVACLKRRDASLGRGPPLTDDDDTVVDVLR